MYTAQPTVVIIAEVQFCKKNMFDCQNSRQLATEAAAAPTSTHRPSRRETSRLKTFLQLSVRAGEVAERRVEIDHKNLCSFSTSSRETNQIRFQHFTTV